MQHYRRITRLRLSADLHYDACVSQSAAPILPLAFPREISRETMAALPIRRYEGDVVLVENHRALML
jgi:hypothetical protein